MTPLTLIFIGRSGSGKGTQAKLLMEELEKRDPSRPVLYIETGAKYREFISSKDPEQTYSRDIAKKIIDEGGLQPVFLTIWAWTDTLVRNMRGNEHLVFDGAPRRVHEPEALDSAMEFYGRGSPYVIYLDIEHETGVGRLLARGREDDTDEAIQKRMGWFETSVVPMVMYYRNNPKYRFLDIKGERSIEAVHADIVEAVFASQ
jgi:adenylate kinase